MSRSVSVVGYELIAHDRFCDALECEISSFASLVRTADLGAAVTTCPGWTIKDLAEHLGGVHRWAAAMVSVLSPERIGGRDVEAHLPTDDYSAWIADGGDILLRALRAADPDARMWSWGEDKHARFWPRRQLHETAIHRADLSLSLGFAPAFADWIALDGVDEFLANLAYASYFAPQVDKLRGNGETIALRAGGEAWSIRLLPDRFEWRREDSDAKVTVEGAPADLYLFAWGRHPAEALTIKGDRSLLDTWVENSRI